MPNTVSSVDLSQAAANSPTLAKNFSIASLVSAIFSFVVPLAGAILLLLLLYGGFTYLTAAGNDEQVAKAKKIMTQAIIGIIIVAFSFGIGLWVINTLGINSNGPSQIATTSKQVGAANVKNVVITPQSSATSQGPGPATGIYNSIAMVTPNTQIAQSITGNSVDSGDGIVINSNSVDSNDTTNSGLKGSNPTGTSFNDSNNSITSNSVTASGTDQGSGGICIFGLGSGCDSSTTNDGSVSGETGTVTPPNPVTISGGQTAPVITGYTYNIVVTTETNTTCTATNTLDNDTIISAIVGADGSCQVQFLNDFKPTSGTVTINALDADTNKPLSGVNINVQGQQAATTNSAGDTNTQYLKGATNSNGTTSFTIDQAGSRMTTASLNGYISCNKNLLLTSGNAIIIYMNKVTDNTSSCKTETFLLTTDTSTSSPVPTSDSNTSATSNLPQPAANSTDSSTDSTLNSLGY